MFAFLAGWRLYAAIGLLVAFAALGGYAAFERQSAIAATAKVDLANERTKSVAKERDDALGKLKQDEADKADLNRRLTDLDAIVSAQQERERKLQQWLLQRLPEKSQR